MPEKCSDPPLSVKYDGTYEVSCGAPLEIADTEKQPIVTWNEVSQDAGYTLMMVDPDAPSPENPTLADYRHWLVVNIQGRYLVDGMLYGEVLTNYMGPSPPQGSGYHRYFLYLFKQPNESMHFDAVPASRSQFNPEEFANKYNLGEPVAVNFFIAEFQEREEL
jgi:phosphatidylethanolamine-binding protein (PEBP) family uncharacterized protein